MLVRSVVTSKTPNMEEVLWVLIVFSVAAAAEPRYFIRVNCPPGEVILESDDGAMTKIYKSESNNEYMFSSVAGLHRYIYTCGGTTTETWSTRGMTATVTNSTLSVQYGMSIPDGTVAKMISICRPSGTDNSRTLTRSQTAPEGNGMTLTYEDLFDNIEEMQVCRLHLFVDRHEIDALEIKLTPPITTSPSSAPTSTTLTTTTTTRSTSTYKSTSPETMTHSSPPGTISSESSGSKDVTTTTLDPRSGLTTSTTTTSKETTTTLTTTSTSSTTSPTTRSKSTTPPLTTTTSPNSNTTTTVVTTTTTTTTSPDVTTPSSAYPEESTTTTSEPMKEQEDTSTKSESDVTWIIIYSVLGILGLSLTGGLAFVICAIFAHCSNRSRSMGGTEVSRNHTYKEGDRLMPMDMPMPMHMPMAMPQVAVNMGANGSIRIEDNSKNNSMTIAPPKPPRTSVLSVNELRDRIMGLDREHSADRRYNEVETGPDDHDPQGVAVTEDDDGGKPNFMETAV